VSATDPHRVFDRTINTCGAEHRLCCPVQHLLAMNIEAEKPEMSSSAIAVMVLSFFSGLCIERNLNSSKAFSTRKIENFMTALRSL
jgi:hypothetical protein